MRKAVLYLRSSKDQKDVSIQVQRLELTGLAEGRGLQIVGEYSDVVESGKDYDRPGFQQLIKAIRNRSRGWEVVLTKDTSRIARGRLLSLIFEEHECAANDVDLIYSNIPEGGDPAATMMLRTMMQGFDEYHSMTSRAKGLAGMAENVRQGYRAAGTAPHGYRLKRNEIGIVREGAAVTKSTLEPTEAAGAVQRYLELRAAGTPRAQAARAAEMQLQASSLIGVEWNALTYAGCTTFGVYHQRTSSGAYKGKRKRRPRTEWMIQEGTHPALISRPEAEAILHALETSTHAVATSKGRASISPYALSGLLETPGGVGWEVNKRTHYHAPRQDGRCRYIPIETLDRAVIGKVMAAVATEGLAQLLLDQTRASTPDHAAQIKQLQREIAGIAVKVDKAASLALELEDPAPYLRKIDALERERRQAVARQAALQEAQQLNAAAAEIGLEEIREVLAGLAENLRSARPDMVKLALRGFVRRVVLDPDTLAGSVDYHVAVGEINPACMALLRERPACGALIGSEPLDLEYRDGRSTRWKRS